MQLLVNELSTSVLISSLVFGVAVPLGSLAVLAIGCGDNRRQLGKKKKAIGSHKKHASVGSRKKHVPASSRSFSKQPDVSSKKAKHHQRSVRAELSKPESKRIEIAKVSSKTTTSAKLPSKHSGVHCRKAPAAVSKSSTPLNQLSQKQSVPSLSQKQSVPSLSQKQSVPSLSQKILPKQEKQVPAEAPSSGTPPLLKSDVLPSGSKKNEFATKNALPAYCSETADVSVEPHQLHYETVGGERRITLHNKSKKRQAVKAKCSDNDLYRVKPVHALLEPGKSASFNVYRNACAANVNKLVFLTTEVSNEEVDPSDAFQNSSAKYPMIVVPLIAVENPKPIVSDSRAPACVCVATN